MGQEAEYLRCFKIGVHTIARCQDMHPNIYATQCILYTKDRAEQVTYVIRWSTDMLPVWNEMASLIVDLDSSRQRCRTGSSAEGTPTEVEATPRSVLERQLCPGAQQADDGC